MLKRYTLFCQYEERPYAHVYAKWAMVFALIAFALTLSPFHFEIASSNSFSWKYGEFMCKSVHYIQDVSAICSVTTLTFMSLER